MITETKPVFIAEIDDTNELGVRIQVGALDQHVSPETAREIAAELILAAARAAENEREERATRQPVTIAADITALLSPSCRADNCKACSGDAWNLIANAPDDCACDCHREVTA